ncbi:arylamine N-acetyltransferase [Vibrio ponticus]|uniref:Arylamine N-acetyltransferase n=1 Tax=Vibrio ponticus TaxID=265668 RepID=A0A3N3E4U7_9VIBR|nr:arylamine N-acetyltransferase [Vibrio ponticus]ROV61743.1 arylamine N-acetyltransferase [Vibrio ponticus]
MHQPIEYYLEQLEIPTELEGLERINYMIKKHLSLFAFSSTNVVLDRELPLDIESIVERLVERKQGGYCFEHNKLMQLALEQLGYQVRPILARVLLSGNEYNRRSHRLTILTWQGQEYIVDVGFGIGTPQEVIALETREYHWQESHVRLQAIEGQDYRLEKFENDTVLTMYRFDLSETTEDDCDASHFYTHKFPQSNFVNSLVISKIHANKRQLVRRLEVFEYDDLGNETSSAITSAEQMHQIISQQLGLNFSQQEAKAVFEHQLQRAQ